MSYDLTIRSDETYSRSTSRAPLESFIKQQPGIKPNGKHGFVLDARPRRWMEIDLEVVNEEGDNIESGKEISADINCIRLHIPYKFLGDDVEHDYFPTAFAIAEHIGWTLYDDQDDEPVSKASNEETASNAPPSFDRKKFIGDWVSFPYSWGNACMNYEIIEDGRFKVVMLDDANSPSVSAKGSWDLVGDAIQWTYESCKGFPRPRRPELNKILRVDEKRFAIRERSGDESEFWRAIPFQTVATIFALTELRLFLEHLIKLVDGEFATREIDSLMKTANALGSVKSQERVFRIMFQDLVSPLCVRLTIGENNTLKASFSAPVALAEKIAALFKAA